MMVDVATYPITKNLDKSRRQSENHLISCLRSKEILSSILERFIIQKGNWTIGLDKGLPRESIEMFKTNSSIDMIKKQIQPIDRGVSEYWGDTLRYHWPIAIQSFFLVIIILTLGPWIGLRCNDDVSVATNTNDQSSLWRPFMGYTESSKSQSTTTSDSCTYGYFCSNKKGQDGEPVRRRASFLKRKRYIKDFIG